MAVHADDTPLDFSKSTNLFPMEVTPAVMLVNPTINYAKSTGAYAMYDDRNTAARTVEHLGAPVEPTFVTPGPISQGHEAAVREQRKGLGLSADPTGESDAAAAARPTTIVVPGADGVEREKPTSRTKLTEAEEEVEVTNDDGTVEKTVPAIDVTAKVVTAKTADKLAGKVQPTTK